MGTLITLEVELFVNTQRSLMGLCPTIVGIQETFEPILVTYVTSMSPKFKRYRLTSGKLNQVGARGAHGVQSARGALGNQDAQGASGAQGAQGALKVLKVLNVLMVLMVLKAPNCKVL